MTEEQRKAAADRLAKARLAKGHDGSASVHRDLRDMPEDHALHWKKVKEWIKDINNELKHSKAKRDSKDAKDRQWYRTFECYVANLRRYLDSGVYLDARYGRLREGKMITRVINMAYDEDGFPKRTVGHWYPDIGDVYTREMAMEDKKRVRKPRKQLHDKEEVHEVSGDDSL